MQDESILREWERLRLQPPEEDMPVFECDVCGGNIHSGYDYYRIDGKCICEECVNGGRKVAE